MGASLSTDATMRAVELPAKGAPLRMTSRPVPRPGAGEVRVRVEACGICGSDLFLQDGGFGVRLPVVPGHEAAGVVDELGPGVAELEVGDRVAVYYITTPPGDPWAADGVPNRSPYVQRMGVDLDGAFAEYVLRPAEALVRPPHDVEPIALAVLTDAVATPLHALRRIARVEPGETVVVIGIGGIGSNAVQLASALGAKAIAVSRSAEKLELAARLGAAECVVVDGTELGRVREATEGEGAHVVLQCADAPAAYELALAMGGPGGRVVLVGSTSEPFRVWPMPVIWRELAILGSRGFVPADIAEAIDLYEAGRIVVDHLVRSVRPLEEANAALDDLRSGRVLRSVLVP
jgi:D-arabinose 1-dehydrogenase-like Zn-dependent alcohol dehydrogenase